MNRWTTILSLKLASWMAENSESFCRALAQYVTRQTGIVVEYIDAIPWQERERLFDRGEIQLLWICGLPYVHKVDSGANDIEILAVPVPAGERYQHQPVYFSDVVVRNVNAYRSFLELRGARWAFNEPLSHFRIQRGARLLGRARLSNEKHEPKE